MGGLRARCQCIRTLQNHPRRTPILSAHYDGCLQKTHLSGLRHYFSTASIRLDNFASTGCRHQSQQMSVWNTSEEGHRDSNHLQAGKTKWCQLRCGENRQKQPWWGKLQNKGSKWGRLHTSVLLLLMHPKLKNWTWNTF